MVIYKIKYYLMIIWKIKLIKILLLNHLQIIGNLTC
jgi:hypothetical protein